MSNPAPLAAAKMWTNCKMWRTWQPIECGRSSDDSASGEKRCMCENVKYSRVSACCTKRYFTFFDPNQKSPAH